MSRNYILGAGAVAWSVVGLIALGYLVNGSTLIPAMMAITAIPWVAWLAFTRRPLVLRRSTAQAEVDRTS
jgi:fatty acid desaturase